MKRLGINIDHVATIRNARGSFHPDPLTIAKHVTKCGAHSITIHLREDRRHIKEGSKVLIIEDVITTGKSSLECVKLITKPGAKLIGFASIIDRSTKNSLKIKKNIISHMKIYVPTLKKNLNL